MDYQARYEEWLSKLSDSDPLKAELVAIASDEKDKEERFYQDLSFGTAGLRGKVGAGTNRMNFFTVGKASQGVADYIVSKGQEAMDKGVVIAHDPRHFSREFSELAAGIFAANGIKVYTFPSLRPTPELAFMIRRLGTVSGINITASHNPKDYNGYKAYWDDGCQVSAEVADGMTKCINAVDIWTGIKKSDYNEGVKAGKIIVLGQEYDREYLDKIESLAIHEGDELDLSIPLVYTPLNGCGSIPFRQMLNDRGFTNWKIVPEQENPDPDFTTVGYPNPEDPKAFALSEKYGREFGAELLMATDPDSDRFAIEIRDDNGNYVPLNGNQTGYLLVNYVLEGHKSAGTLPAKGAMVKSIVTSTLSTIIAKAYGVEMFETLTGFKNICGKIPYLHENGYQYLFGYEESVGYAICEDIRDKDGISAGMMVAEAAAYYRKQGKTLWDVLNEIYAKYGFFAEDEPNLVLEGIAGQQRISRMMKFFRDNIPTEVAGAKVDKVIDYINGYEDIPPQNAIRLFLDNGSWFAVRPSGTEPKIKFYFYSNRSSREEALKVNADIKKEILDLLSSVE
ncbi:MAG: phospho-sugar mutase [Butyrivibrio sp.]|jgi:phosphoglucomutase|uniref:phospho-sugar mutase n=1 Tax=Butyrivibrio sp. TaxID=28121 RepID=UPI001B4038D2|nr:phospho-sugar mutase [Butyrivibrio sp.]MBP3783757.1 phospho-sugar mutase [Butyrivibrio sp.]MBP3814840.1 phospho-sugar mutase [Butyrivibrio sp.]